MTRTHCTGCLGVRELFVFTDNIAGFQSQMTNEVPGNRCRAFSCIRYTTHIQATGQHVIDHDLQVKKGGLQAAGVELQELVTIKAPEVSPLFAHSHPDSLCTDGDAVGCQLATADGGKCESGGG